MNGAQPRRPLGIGETLGGAFGLYIGNAVSLWKIVACVVVPVSLLNQILIAVSLPSTAFVHNGLLYTPTGQLGIPTGVVVASLALTVVALLIAGGAVAISLVDAYVRQPLHWTASIRAAGRRFGSLLWLSLLWTVLVFLGFVALIVPGIFLLVAWSVSVPALMFEGISAFKSLGRSFDLVRGRWFATLAALFVAILSLGVVTYVVQLLLGAIAKGLKVDSIGLWLGFNWLGSLFSELVTYPFISAVIAVIYIDLRVRKEGLDVGTLASGSREPDSTAVAASG